MGTRHRSPSRWHARGLVALLLAFTLVVAACGGGDEAATEASPGATGAAGGGEEGALRVSWWGGDERHQATNDAIALYEEQNPNVTVEPEFSGFDGYNDRLATQAAGGNAPCVFQVDPSAVREYADAGALLNLDDYVGSGLSLEGIPENIADLGRTPEGLFALPWGVTAPILVTNPNEFFGTDGPQPDWTWEQYGQWAQEVTDASGGEVHGTADMGFLDDALRIWLRQQGQSLYTEEGELGFDEAALTEYFTYWNDLRESGAAVPAEVSARWSGAPEDSALVTGDAASEFGYTSTSPAVASVAGVEVGQVRLPGNADTAGDYLRPSVFLSASANCENPELAMQFMDFMLNNAEAGEILGVTRGVPPNEDVREAIRDAIGEEAVAEIDYIAEIADEVGPPPPLAPAGAFEIISLLRRSYEPVAFGELTPAEGAQQFFSEAPSILGG